MKATKLLALGLILAFSSCKKEDNSSSTPTTAAKQSDQSGSSAADSGIDDVNDYVSNKIGGGSSKRVSTYNLPCGVVSVDSATVNGKKEYTFHYGKQNACGYKYKSGLISFQLVQGTHFSDKGAINKITYTDYTVQSNATNDIVTINGTLYTTNVNGGFIWQSILFGDTIIHKLRGSFTTKYANGDVRPRDYYQLRTWTSANGWAGLTFRVQGDTVINSIKIMEIGKTYDGNHDYQTQLLNDYVWSNCGSSFLGPYVLKEGTARLNATVAGISPVYFEIEAGYHYVSPSATPTKKNDCSSNAYKITTVIGTTTKTEYQLY